MGGRTHAEFDPEIREQLIGEIDMSDTRTWMKLREMGAPIEEHIDYITEWAAANGNVDVLRYLHRTRCYRRISPEAMAAAAQSGSAKCIEWVMDFAGTRSEDNACYDDGVGRLMKALIRRGDMKPVRRLHGKGWGLPDDEALVADLAAAGRTDIMEWMHGRGVTAVECNNLAAGYAAANGHLETLEWLCGEGASVEPPYNYAVINAARNGHAMIMKWLHAHGADLTADGGMPLLRAAANGHVETASYIIREGRPSRQQKEDALLLAAENGQLGMVKLLHETGTDMHMGEDRPLRTALDAGQEETAEWIRGAP